MEETQFKIVSKEGAELDLTSLNFKGKVAIISYDGDKVGHFTGLQRVVDSIKNDHGAAGVFLLDKNFDLLAMDEEDLGMNPDFAYKFLDNICKKSRHKKYHVKDKPNKSMEEYKIFHSHFAEARMKIYRKVAAAAFNCGWLTGILLIAGLVKNSWNLVVALGAFGVFCNVIYRIKRGDYEQEAQEEAGNKTKGRSYNPDDYI